MERFHIELQRVQPRLAEQLASFAKRRVRGLNDGETNRSVVGWDVYRTAWIEVPVVVRRRDGLRGSGNELHLISQRRVFVLCQGLNSLQGLVRGAGQLTQSLGSQRRPLVDQRRPGRVPSELAFSELADAAKGPLAGTGVTEPLPGSLNNGTWITSLLDLMKIAEITRLGGNIERVGAEWEAAHV